MHCLVKSLEYLIILDEYKFLYIQIRVLKSHSYKYNYFIPYSCASTTTYFITHLCYLTMADTPRIYTIFIPEYLHGISRQVAVSFKMSRKLTKIDFDLINFNE